MQRTEGDRQRRQDLADVADGGRALRLLPWETDTGKPCYLNTSSEASPLSQLADDMELVQLTMGDHVLREARKILDDPMSPHSEVRYAGVRLAECLNDALRVAKSRGMRLPVPDDPDDENGAQSDAESPSEATA